MQNHEYSDDVLLFPDGTANWNAAKTAKALAAHGVSVIELRRRRGEWSVVRPSRYARRITGATPITISGPAAGHELLRTGADPSGRRVDRWMPVIRAVGRPLDGRRVDPSGAPDGRLSPRCCCSRLHHYEHNALN